MLKNVDKSPASKTAEFRTSAQVRRFLAFDVLMTAQD